MGPRKANHINTGRRDAKNRTIWLSKAGREFVLTNTGTKQPPAQGRGVRGGVAKRPVRSNSRTITTPSTLLWRTRQLANTATSRPSRRSPTPPLRRSPTPPLRRRSPTPLQGTWRFDPNLGVEVLRNGNSNGWLFARLPGRPNTAEAFNGNNSVLMAIHDGWLDE